MDENVLSTRELMAYWAPTLRWLSIEQHGVDLGTHWPERAQRLAGRRREARRERVLIYLWMRQARTYRNVFEAALRDYNRLW